MRKLSQIPMRIRTACEALEKELHRGNKGTIINTEFGILGVEFHEVGRMTMIDPLHSASVTTWSDAPGTFWVKSMKNHNADFYVCIEIYKSRLHDHLAIIEGLSRAMFFKLGFDDPTDKIINAAVECFTMNYDEVDETVESLADEYMDNYMSMFYRKRPDVKVVVREMIETKQLLSREVLRSAEQLSKEFQRSNDTSIFYDHYSEVIWGIYLYTLYEDQNSLSTKIKNLAQAANIELDDVTDKFASLAVNK